MCDPPWEGSPVVEHFGPYRLDELIGRGGMGEVFRAFDTLRKRTVALKRLRPSLLADPEFQARFRAESELAARLRSAHVIPIHDYGEIDGRLYIDMRLVDGEDMGDRLTARGAMPPADVVDVLGQIAGALDAAHAAGLVHRDVKPSNVLLSPADGVSGRDFAYLVDFGIARAADGTGALTGSGPIVGTVDYMAPERFERRSPDHRVDVYALACVMFEALTGMKPFVTDSLAGLLYSHLHEPRPWP
jgi:serine/threonine protein kinase